MLFTFIPFLILLTLSLEFSSKQSILLTQLRKSYSSSNSIISSSSSSPINISSISNNNNTPSTIIMTQLYGYTKYANNQTLFCRLLTTIIDDWVAGSNDDHDHNDGDHDHEHDRNDLGNSPLSSDLFDRLLLTCSAFQVS